MTCDDVKPLLDGRMDDEIDPVQRQAIDTHLETCSSCAMDLEKLASVRYAVRGEMPYYRAPAELKNQVRFALRGAEYLDRPRPASWRTWGAIAASAAFCALASAPFLVNARNQRQLVAEEFLSAHARALAGRTVDVVSSDQHTVKPWFNGRLPFSPPVIDLASEGFPLEGGRVDYAAGHAVAALVYGRRLHSIDLFIRPSEGEKAPPSNFERDGFSEVSWTKDSFLFTAVSDVNVADLRTFVNLLRAR
jgi:anti-sigma factor RsiW